MIIQSLARYYDILAKDPDSGIPTEGYSVTGVHFAVVISPEGKLLNLIPLKESVTRGKKIVEVPQHIQLPARVKRASNILSNYLADNASYVFGLGNPEKKDADYGKLRFEAFREKNLQLIEGLQTPAALALSRFLQTWTPQMIETSPVLQENMEDLQKGGNLVFQLLGNPGYIHEDPEIAARFTAPDEVDEARKRQCLVTGEQAPIARLHTNISGIAGATSTGAALVGFNLRAFESYGLKQGDNAPVSEAAMFAYTTALNYLTSPANPHRPLRLGETTVVYWAQSNSPAYADVFEALLNLEGSEPKQGEESQRDPGAERLLAAIAGKIEKGLPIDNTEIKKSALDEQTKFYVLGISPNAARLSVRFFEEAAFGQIVARIVQHHEDMRITGRRYPISVWRLLNETVSPKASKREAAPLLGGAVMRSILSGLAYPAALLSSIVLRVKTDQDDPNSGFYKVNANRVGAIKACLLRKYRYQAKAQILEALNMSLNPETNYKPYVLGRLFAYLEKAQLDAAGGPAALNTTIKDRYFASACASPATVFPTLLKLSQHHVAKAEYGKSLDRGIGAVLEKLDETQRPFPAHFSLDEQGAFILGYYHQRSDFYKPRNADSPTEENTIIKTQAEEEER